MESYKLKEIETGIFWKYKNKFVRVFCDKIGNKKSYFVGIKTGKRNQTELLSGLFFWDNIKDVVEFLEVNINKKVKLIKDVGSLKENLDEIRTKYTNNFLHYVKNKKGVRINLNKKAIERELNLIYSITDEELEKKIKRNLKEEKITIKKFLKSLN